MIVHDLSNPDSLNNVHQHIKNFKRLVIPDGLSRQVYLIGAKQDLTGEEGNGFVLN